MTLTKTEENVIIWGGACMILILIAIISYISYRMFLPKKIAKAKQRIEDIISLRNHAKKVQVVTMIKGAKTPDNSAKISPELSNTNNSRYEQPPPVKRSISDAVMKVFSSKPKDKQAADVQKSDS